MIRRLIIDPSLPYDPDISGNLPTDSAEDPKFFKNSIQRRWRYLTQQEGTRGAWTVDVLRGEAHLLFERSNPTARSSSRS